ncbi:DNA adenine methylase [Ruminiclostridium josui]|uniref:DNA adenine methylase n=1 Tax=Ruminiclostridium josui TaxID=1499 RepID=UPI000463C591|nr:DNA adenine methylase [Ruminiclostridium josui]
MRNLSLFSYFGGKNRLSRRLADRIKYKEIRIFIEGFAGSAALSLNKPNHNHRICNDLNPKIFLVLQALSRKDSANEFIRCMFQTKYSQECFNKAQNEWARYDEEFNKLIPEMLKMTEFTPELFEKANNMWKSIIHEENAVEMAVHALVLLKQSYNGLMKRWRGIKNGDEGFRYEQQLNYLRDIAEKLEGTEVYNVNTIMLINKYRDCKDVFFYLDPPYEMRTRGKKKTERKSDYEIEMPDEIQLEFIKAVKDAKCPIIISGYKRNNKSIYDNLVDNGHWKCEMFAEVHKSSAITSAGTTKPVDVEFIWYNF